jgi:hypothetical protein
MPLNALGLGAMATGAEQSRGFFSSAAIWELASAGQAQQTQVLRDVASMIARQAI